jgi:hypothetical protein
VQFEIETLIEERSRKIYSKVFPKLIATDGRGASGSESFLHPVTLSSQKMHVSTDEFPSNGASLKSPNPLHHFKKMREGVCLPHGGFNSSITESESKESKESTEAEDHTHPHLRANSFARYSTTKRSITNRTSVHSNSLQNFDLRNSRSRQNSRSHQNQSLPSTINGSEYEWRTKNSEHLEELEAWGKMKRRRSSMLKFVQTMQAFDEIENNNDDDDDDNKSCDSFYQKIDETIHKTVEEEAFDPLSFNMSTASFSESIQLSDLSIAEPMAARRRSVRFSLISRRSTRMSLVFRQSCADILGDLSDEDDEEDDDQDNTRFPPLPARKSHYIPDVFKSRHDKRRSVIIESSSQFLDAMYGDGSAGKLVGKPERRSIILDNILAPITHDDLLEEIHNSY